MRYRVPLLKNLLLLIFLLSATRVAIAQVNVSLPSIQGSVGEAVTIDVLVGDLSGHGILAYDFIIVFDESVLNITGFETAGTRSQGASVVLNTNKVDTIRVAAATASELSGSGSLLKLKATIVTQGSTDLEFSQFIFNDGAPEATTIDGRVSTANQGPSAVNVSTSTLEDTAVEVTLSGTDPEGSDLTFAISVQPANGTLGAISVVNGTSANVTYTPAENFSGTDTFTYTVSDGNSTATGTVTVTVTAVNDAPGVPVITSPEEGAVLTVGGETRETSVGGNTVLFRADWAPVTDPEGSQVTYSYQVASDAAFTNVLETRAVGTTTEAAVTVAQAAAFFDAVHGSAQLGANATLFHRVVASDGTLVSTGSGSTIVLVRGTVTSQERQGELPSEFALQGNYPNPFNPSTVIRFDLPAPAEVTVEISDAAGRRVLVLPAQNFGAGADQTIDIEASGLVSGIYVYRVSARFADQVLTRSSTMTLLR